MHLFILMVITLLIIQVWNVSGSDNKNSRIYSIFILFFFLILHLHEFINFSDGSHNFIHIIYLRRGRSRFGPTCHPHWGCPHIKGTSSHRGTPYRRVHSGNHPPQPSGHSSTWIYSYALIYINDYYFINFSDVSHHFIHFIYSFIYLQIYLISPFSGYDIKSCWLWFAKCWGCCSPSQG